MAYSVKKLADLASVTVRTLHHYDHIRLLKPASVSPSGYRQYSDADLARLQQILFFREMGFSLREIKAIIDDPHFDRIEALRSHRQLLIEQHARISRLIQSVDRTIDSVERGVHMDEQGMFDGFDQAQIEAYRAEARAKWGSEIVDESDRRVSKYSRDDWAAIGAETQAIEQGAAGLMDRDPADPEVQQFIVRWFRLINGHFYTCTPEIFRRLGDGYVADPRFIAHYDLVRPGLAAFMCRAMHVYADMLESGAGS